MKITAESPKGGAVTLNEEHNVWTSYAVAGAGNTRPELLYSNIKLKNGKNVQVFINRENGLVTVNVTRNKSQGGVEIFRELVK